MSTKKSWKTRNGALTPPREPPLDEAEAVKRQVVIESAKLKFSCARPLSSVMRAGCQSSVSGKYSRSRIGRAEPPGASLASFFSPLALSSNAPNWKLGAPPGAAMRGMAPSGTIPGGKPAPLAARAPFAMCPCSISSWSMARLAKRVCIWPPCASRWCRESSGSHHICVKPKSWVGTKVMSSPVSSLPSGPADTNS